MVRADRAGQPIGAEEASAYHVGLYAAKLLQTHFARFYTRHVAGKRITPAQLLGCCVAFWHLVEQAGLPLRWPHDEYGDISRGKTPAESLTMFDGVSVEFLSDLGYSLMTPRPEYYGIGVQSVLEEWADVPDALTVTLWHLFQHTSLSVGVSLEWEPLADAIGEEVLSRIMRMKPLAADTALNTLGLHLQIPEAKDLGAYNLIAYAFGKTDNELANWTDYEVEAITMGEQDEEWSWSRLDQMVKLAAEARLLCASYAAWSARINANPLRELPKLAGAIHKAARAAEREMMSGSKTLAMLFGDNETDARHFVEALNAL